MRYKSIPVKVQINIRLIIIIVNWGDFGQRGNFGQFFNISVLCLYKEFLDEMFLLWSWVINLYDIITSLQKFFVQRQYRDVENLSRVAPLSKVAPVDGYY